MSLPNTDKNAMLKTLLSSFTLTVAAGSLALLVKPSQTRSDNRQESSPSQRKSPAKPTGPESGKEE
jgi:hypothetical protein